MIIGFRAAPGQSPKRRSGDAGAGLGWHEEEDDRDSLHILPLSTIPLETPSLRRARLIKNIRLQTVVELFNDAQAGSGQIRPEQLHLSFQSGNAGIRRDIAKIQKIAQAASFDVYSLRIELRRLGIDLEQCDSLQLSPRKRAQLTRYMRVFTRPLIERIYGEGDVEIESVEDLTRMITHPNLDNIRLKLRLMAERLEIDLAALPNFLEEYGDIFLSLAYFRKCLDEIVPDIQTFINWMEEIRSSSEVRRDYRTGRTLDEVGSDLTEISTSITGRFECFDNRSRSFWDNLSAQTFYEIRSLITNHHVTIGGVLCGLAVKMNLWKARFARVNNPSSRLEFLKSEILPGLSHIKEIERSARM
jgi:hypothetical protein